MNLSGLDEINADIGRFNYLYVGNQQFYAYTGAGPSGMGPTGPQGPIGTAGTTGATGPQGLSIFWRGAYNNASTYLVNDAVSYSGGSYICIRRTTGGNNPSDNSYWNLMAQQGDQGARGPAGSNGNNGSDGNDGDTGPTGPQGDQGPAGNSPGIGDIINAILGAAEFVAVQTEIAALQTEIGVVETEIGVLDTEVADLQTKTMYQSIGTDGIHNFTNFASDLHVGATSQILLQPAGTSTFQSHIDTTGYNIKCDDLTCNNIVGNVAMAKIDNNPSIDIGKNSGTNNSVNIGSGILGTTLSMDGANISVGSATTTSVLVEGTVATMMGASQYIAGTNYSFRNNTTTTITDTAAVAVNILAPTITLGTSASYVYIPGTILSSQLNLSGAAGFLSQF